MTLAEYRAAVRATLGDPGNASGDWPDDLVDEGLRGGLLVYGQAAPFAEAEMTVTAAGRVQDLSGVDPDLLTVVSVAWLWDEDLLYTARLARFEPVGHGVVRVGSGIPQVGDVIRFRYIKRYRIEGLDGAASTTVPAAHADMVVLASAAHACGVRMRQLAALPSAPVDEVSNLRDLRDYYGDQAEVAMRSLAVVVNPAWEEVGL